MDPPPYLAAMRKVCTQGALGSLEPSPQGAGLLPDVDAAYFAAWMKHRAREWGLSLESGTALPLQLQAALLIRNTGLFHTSGYRTALVPGAVDLVDRVPLVGESTRQVNTFPPCWGLYSEVVNDVVARYNDAEAEVYIFVAGGAARAYKDGMLPKGTQDLDIWLVMPVWRGRAPSHAQEYAAREERLVGVLNQVRQDICYKLHDAGVRDYTYHDGGGKAFYLSQVRAGDDFKVDLIPVYARTLTKGRLRTCTWEKVARALLEAFDMPAARIAYYPTRETCHLLMVRRHLAHFSPCHNPAHTRCSDRGHRYLALYPFCTATVDPDADTTMTCYDVKGDPQYPASGESALMIKELWM